MSAWLRDWATRADRYGSICTGAFAVEQPRAPDGEGAGADRSIAVGPRRPIAQPGAHRRIVGQIGQRRAAGDERGAEHAGGIGEIQIGRHRDAVRGAHRAHLAADHDDVVAVLRRDKTVGLREHVERPGDVERLDAVVDHDGDRVPGHKPPLPHRIIQSRGGRKAGAVGRNLALRIVARGSRRGAYRTHRSRPVPPTPNRIARHRPLPRPRACARNGARDDDHAHSPRDRRRHHPR